jgi:hypothetical protein
VYEQLGLEFDYTENGSGGRPLAEAAGWGAGWQSGGSIGSAEILFPRVEIEAA